MTANQFDVFETVWNSLLAGDPGPALALVDTLLDHDMAFAAGGLLQDFAERKQHAADVIEDARQRAAFESAVQQVLDQAYDGTSEQP